MGITHIPSGFLVKSPVGRVDISSGSYNPGKIVPGAFEGGTAYLEVTLPREQCPGWQRAALAQWQSVAVSTPPISDTSQLDLMFGKNNWKCLQGFPTAVKITTLKSKLTIQYPYISVDEPSGKYGVGQYAPAGSVATVWFAGQCPSDTPTTIDCPTITEAQINQLKSIKGNNDQKSGVENAIHQAESFAGYRQHDYKVGDTLPAGVLIATDLKNSDITHVPVPVIPVNNWGGWGLFVTTSSFIATNVGTYWCKR